MAVKGVLAIVDDIEGGNRPFAVRSTSVRDAQGVDNKIWRLRSPEQKAPFEVDRCLIKSKSIA